MLAQLSRNGRSATALLVAALILAVFTIAAEPRAGGQSGTASQVALTMPTAHASLLSTASRQWLRGTDQPQLLVLAAVLLALLLFGRGRFAPGRFGATKNARYRAPVHWGKRAPPSQSFAW